MKQIALPIVVVIAVLLAFSSPAAADYSGDHPLTIYKHGTICNGGLVYDTVTDGSKYETLYPVTYAWESVFPGSRPTVYQDLTVSIPDGATVIMARLYNTYCWSCWGSDDYAAGPPAQARLKLTSPEGETWTTGDLTHSYTPANRDDCPNPINSTNCPSYPTGVVHYWDTKGQDYFPPGETKWDMPSGEFAWDVTGLVTHNGIYNASICDPRDRSRVGDERFVTFGFGLLVVYKEPGSPGIEYWIAEGCDALLARSFETPENATSNTTFGGVSTANIIKADLTTVLTCSNKWNQTNWDASQNMIYFNGLTDEDRLGPSTAVGDMHYGVNLFNVTSLLSPDENVVAFQDRDDCEYVHNAWLVVEREVIVDTEPPVITCPADVTVEQETGDGTVVPLTATAIDNCYPDPTITSDELPIYPVGTTTVTFTATDASGNSASCTTTVTVTPLDTTPPDISVTVSPDTLWPPNHMMVNISANVTVSDDSDPNPVVILANVTSSEPDNTQGKAWDINDNASGDGNTVTDIQGAVNGTADYEFQLRAERAGKGDGRVYTITYTATDIYGNSASASATVVVPLDMSS